MKKGLYASICVQSFFVTNKNAKYRFSNNAMYAHTIANLMRKISYPLFRHRKVIKNQAARYRVMDAPAEEPM